MRREPGGAGASRIVGRPTAAGDDDDPAARPLEPAEVGDER